MKSSIKKFSTRAPNSWSEFIPKEREPHFLMRLNCFNKISSVMINGECSDCGSNLHYEGRCSADFTCFTCEFNHNGANKGKCEHKNIQHSRQSAQNINSTQFVRNESMFSSVTKEKSFATMTKSPAEKEADERAATEKAAAAEKEASRKALLKKRNDQCLLADLKFQFGQINLEIEDIKKTLNLLIERSNAKKSEISELESEISKSSEQIPDP